jgi:hypothetical protein
MATKTHDVREIARDVLDEIQHVQCLLGDIVGKISLLPDTVHMCKCHGKASAMHDCIQELWHEIDSARRSMPLPAQKTGCPNCRAKLPGDGSCCDACGWTRED